MKHKIGISMVMLLLLCGCTTTNSASTRSNEQEQQNESEVDTSKESTIMEEKKDMITKMINIDGQSFTIHLYNNQTTNEIMEMFPLQVTMDDLNRNEKFVYLTQSVYANSKQVGSVKKGELMLFGTDCLVLFYESFSTSYSYTPIGMIDQVEALDALQTKGSIQVTFS